MSLQSCKQAEILGLNAKM